MDRRLDASVSRYVLGRESGDCSTRGSERRLHFPTHFAKLLAPGKELQGHNGCVNRLAWNESGTMLASGSDDRKVMLWSYPDVDRAPICIDTRHELNIFGVSFLPSTHSSMVVTSGLDRMVQLHRLDRTSVPTAGPSRLSTEGAAPVAAQSVECHTQVFHNHSETVKDVAVEPGNPHCFWSASLDGRVHQFDLRNADMSEPDAPNMLIHAPQLSGPGRLEFNSLDINSVRPWLMATACSDHQVRVYDRRKLSLRYPSASASSASLLDLCPLHLHISGQNPDMVYTTCARFSHRGDRLVATYNREQAYTFDVQGASRTPQMRFCSTRPNLSALEAAARNNDAGGPTGSPGAPHAGPLDEEANEMREEANRAVMQDRWHDALRLYNQLILRVPWLAHSWAARAIVLLHRGWKGDAMWALRDADTCVALNPGWHKAYETRIRCLSVLGQIRTAMTELNLLLEEFPDEAGSSTLQTLRAQLEKELAEKDRGRRGAPAPLGDPGPGPGGAGPSGSNENAANGLAAGTHDHGVGNGTTVEEHKCPKNGPCRSYRAYLRSLQPASESELHAHIHPRSNQAGAREPGPAAMDARMRTTDAQRAEPHASAAEPAQPHRNGTSLQTQWLQGDSRDGGGRCVSFALTEDVLAAQQQAHEAEHAQQSVAEAAQERDGTGLDNGGSESPAGDRLSHEAEGVVRWVRNALQQSWGAWLAGENAPGSWDACRQQAASAADAVFLDALRDHVQQRQPPFPDSCTEAERQSGRGAGPGEGLGPSHTGSVTGSCGGLAGQAAEVGTGGVRNVWSSAGMASRTATAPHDSLCDSLRIESEHRYSSADAVDMMDTENTTEHGELSIVDGVPVQAPVPVGTMHEEGAGPSFGGGGHATDAGDLRDHARNHARDLARGGPGNHQNTEGTGTVWGGPAERQNRNVSPSPGSGGGASGDGGGAGVPEDVAAEAGDVLRRFGAAREDENDNDAYTYDYGAYDDDGYNYAGAEGDGSAGALERDDDEEEDDDDREMDGEEEDADYERVAQAFTRGRMFRRAGGARMQHAPKPSAGPELTSYIYGHRSWYQSGAQQFEPPAGCADIKSIGSLEAKASHSMRTLQRFVGHCNIVTHIKEATFMGQDDAVVACGSDHGKVFLFDSITGELLRVLWADREVANCAQCHPTLPVLATSGLEYVVKLWEVQDGDAATAVGAGEEDMYRLVQGNQEFLNSSQSFFNPEAELENLVRNPEMLQLLRMTRVQYRQGDEAQTEFVCRQS